MCSVKLCCWEIECCLSWLQGIKTQPLVLMPSLRDKLMGQELAHNFKPMVVQWHHQAGFNTGLVCQGLNRMHLDGPWGSPVQHITCKPRKAARPSPKEKTDPASALLALLMLQSLEWFWERDVWHWCSIPWYYPFSVKSWYGPSALADALDPASKFLI